ncbi:MAG: fibronectin type III domain-containing protein, partial [Bacteroidales bacterium]|nr:fibronectin type III domain-containing protein [Bacteroidales bacterium]
MMAIVAVSACGKGEEPVTPNPEQPVPSVPQNVKLNKAGETSLTFQWDPVVGAMSYGWKLAKDGTTVAENTEKTRNCTVNSLEKGTVYTFSVCATNASGSSAYSTPIQAKTEGTQPLPQDPSATVLCVDAPLVIPFDKAPVLGTSGLVQVFKSDGTLVDRIDLADISKVEMLSDGTMIPKGADADAGMIAINNDSSFHTFMDALHSNQYRIVHYTPFRVVGKTLEIKLHNEALAFGESYYVTVDESVAGKAVRKDDMPFTVKAAPSGKVFKVAADGSGDFCTVQGALSHISRAVGKDDAVTIEIGEGTYRELLFLRNKNNVTIQGASREKTVIAYPNNDSYETGSGASVSARPALGKSIGKSGGRGVFLVEGCDNLVLENLTIENTYSIPSHKGQAETIYFNSQYRLTVEDCSLISWQDTFLCKGKVWVHNSLIAGHVDYIWGYPEACLFEDCEIRSRAGGYIVQAR